MSSEINFKLNSENFFGKVGGLIKNRDNLMFFSRHLAFGWITPECNGQWYVGRAKTFSGSQWKEGIIVLHLKNYGAIIAIIIIFLLLLSHLLFLAKDVILRYWRKYAPLLFLFFLKLLLLNGFKIVLSSRCHRVKFQI